MSHPGPWNWRIRKIMKTNIEILTNLYVTKLFSWDQTRLHQFTTLEEFYFNDTCIMLAEQSVCLLYSWRGYVCTLQLPDRHMDKTSDCHRTRCIKFVVCVLQRPTMTTTMICWSLRATVHCLLSTRSVSFYINEVNIYVIS